jgi:hypothetical protein
MQAPCIFSSLAMRRLAYWADREEKAISGLFAQFQPKSTQPSAPSTAILALRLPRAMSPGSQCRKLPKMKPSPALVYRDQSGFEVSSSSSS